MKPHFWAVLAFVVLLSAVGCSTRQLEGEKLPPAPIPTPYVAVTPYYVTPFVDEVRPTQPPAPSSTTLYVCVDAANIRSGPGINYSVRKQLSRGTAVTVYQRAGEWYYLGRDSANNDYYAHQSVLCDQVTEPERPTTASQTSGCPSGCTEPKPGCVIKGNVSFDTGEKIYHVPGGRYYDATVINPAYGERWFCTEEEAVANGWRKSLR
jgi:hypothetical protein